MSTTRPTRSRLDPRQRREQLLDLGVGLLSEHRLEDVSIDLLADVAGISRGLLYHYFSSKRDFHLAVLQRMADQVFLITAPARDASPMDQLVGSLDAYLGFVSANRESYVAFVRAAAAGDEAYRRIYDDARAALTGRIFDETGSDVLAGFGIVDSSEVRLMVRGWSAMVEDVVLAWLQDPRGVTRPQLLRMLATALPALGSVVSPTR